MKAMKALTYPHLVSTKGVCGGKARIDGTRIRVMDVVALHLQGLPPAQILDAYPDLTLAQVHSALAYYYDNKKEIDGDFARAREAEKRFKESK